MSITLTPKLPTLTVTKLDTVDELKRVGKLIREQHYRFPALKNIAIGTVRTRKNNIYARPIGTDDYAEIIADLNSYLVESSNGHLCITNNNGIVWGDLTDVPFELLIPHEATVY